MHKVNAPKEVKSALMSVLNNIDQDLDENGYEPSKVTDEAIEHLENVLAGDVKEEETSENPEDEVLFERTKDRTASEE